jgi:hypothetical protein
MSDGSGALSKVTFQLLGRQHLKKVLIINLVIGKVLFACNILKQSCGFLKIINTIPVNASF